MKRSAFLLIVFLLLTSLGSYAQNLNKVYGAMAEQDWEVALELLEPIIEKKKKNYEARWLAAICHTERYRFDEAYKLFQEALPFAEVDPSFWIPYAKAYLLGSRVEDAERTLARVNQNQLDDFVKPDYFKVYNNIQNAKKYLPNPKEVIIKNLGPNINTKDNEYSQVVTDDQMGIYYTVRRAGLGEVLDDGENAEMVMASRMNEFDEWQKDNPLEGFSSGTVNEATTQLFNGDSTLVVFKDEDLFVSNLQEDGTWSEREPLEINSNKWDSHAFFYNNGNSLIYSSAVNSADGENADLYIIHKQEDGKWSAPYAIEELNTSENDDSPFVAGDGTLYFSSRGHDSMGGYDIFKTRLDSATGKFSAPENLGAPFNLPNDDTFFTLYGKNAYLSSSRPEGYGQVDIYRVILFNKSKVQGRLMDCDGETPIPNTKITVRKGEEIFETTTDEYGRYSMNFPIEQEFSMTAERGGEQIYEEVHRINVLFRDEFDINHDFFVGECENPKMIYVKMINSFDLDPENIDVEEPEIIEPIVEAEPEPIVVDEVKDVVPVIVPVAEEYLELPNVYFTFDRSNIREQFYERLDETAELLKERTDLRVLVAGHTDAYGTNEYNIALGKRRYTQVYNYLINRGVDPDQLEYKTLSENEPIATNRTIAGRAFNRRVQLYFIDDEGNIVENQK